MFIYSQKKLSTFEDGEVVKCLLMVLMVFNATFNDISVISWWSFIGGGNRSTRKKPPICR
jgi:hypothetical protein